MQSAHLKDLDPVQARRVAALLDEGLDLDPAQRAAWRASVAAREPLLHALVEGMLADMARSDAHTSDRAETAALIARRIAKATRAQTSLAGQMFGPYRVQQLLGHGGMGSVWLALRVDGLFERQVALKLVHVGLAGQALAERFARERRILGSLDHPHIARLLDAGLSEQGQPYLAIEYVEGMPLTAYCDAQRLSLRARVQIMMQVLSAVQYAHQNLVVHRDLKPANILVTPDGQVRLLDFGIAKLLTDGQASETELTHQGGRVLTPDYASPEQIGGGTVSTASDVYSLGVVLYVLLCGQRPYQLRRDSRAALEEAILSAAPLRPSQLVLGKEAALARGCANAKRLAQSLAGDLDTIILKALKKDPAERYATVDALMQDLQRHLDGRPVLARPDSAAYRLMKFVVRNRLKVAGGLVMGGLLLAGAGVSLWQAREARAQATLAQRETQRAQAVQAFLIDIFKANSTQQADPQRARQTTARELLDVGARQAAESLKGSPEAQDEVLDTLADMYYQLGLGDQAAHMRQQRVVALKQAYGDSDVRVAAALLAYARDVAETDQRERADAALAQARQILDRLGDRSSETRGWVSIESAAIEQYTSIVAAQGHADEAVSHFRAHPERWSSLFHALQMSARVHYHAGDFRAAERGHREALELAQRHSPSPSPWVITPLVQLAEAQWNQCKLDDAEAGLRAALALSRQLNGDLGGATLQTQAKVAGFLHATGRMAEGRRVLDEVLAAVQSKEANATPNAVSAVRLFRALAMLAEGRIFEAEQGLRKEIEDLRQHYPGSIPLSRTLLPEAAALTALGRYGAARQAAEEAWRLAQAAVGEAGAPQMRNRYLLELARLSLAQDDPADAEQRLNQVVPQESSLPLRAEDVQAKLLMAQVR
ncbi:MAG TPA: protein kinase, partial [Burkholderiaceae bacterium]|nr:protein kinase [Burkholderiaceae bacterium]